MSDAFGALIGAAGLAVVVGASFTLGVAVVCRWLKWAPVNVTININNFVPTETEA